MGELIDALTTALKAGLGFQAIFFALLAIGINVQFGYTGLLQFGQIAFAMLGAFGIAVSVTQWGLPFWVGVVIGIVSSIVLALLLGLPTLRLRADYLAIATIAAAEGLRLLFRSVDSTPVTGGTRGLAAFNGGLLPPGPWETSRRYKMQALVLGGVIGAVGGMVYAVGTGSAIPDQYQNANTFLAYAALILGGAARVLGPVVGSILLLFIIQFADTGLRTLIANEVIPEGLLTATDVAAIRFVLVGLGLILLLVFRPQGIFGDRREVMLDAR